MFLLHQKLPRAAGPKKAKKKDPRKFWTPEEDAVIIAHMTLKEKLPGRSSTAISMRRIWLKKNGRLDQEVT